MFEGIRQMNRVSQITCHVESRLIGFQSLVRTRETKTIPDEPVEADQV